MKRLLALVFSLALIGASLPASAQVGGLMFPGPGGGHSSGGGGYVATGVNFNGSTFLTGTASTPFTSATACFKNTVSFWFRMDGGNAAFQELFENNNQTGLRLERDSGNFWSFGNTDSTGTAVGNLNTNPNTYTSPDTWHHFMAAVDETTPGSGSGSIFVDGANVTGGFAQGAGPAMAFNAAQTMTIGARNGGSLTLNADIADLWIGFCQYFPPSTPANLAKFRSGTGHPVDLGADASTPTGVAPVAFFSANNTYGGATVANWNVNKVAGQGVTFTVTGTLSAASSNP